MGMARHWLAAELAALVSSREKGSEITGICACGKVGPMRALFLTVVRLALLAVGGCAFDGDEDTTDRSTRRRRFLR